LLNSFLFHFFISQCSLVIYVVQNFLIDDIYLILIVLLSYSSYFNSKKYNTDHRWPPW